MKMKRHQISISGEPGAGKSTAIEHLQQVLGYPIYNIGLYSRTLCEKMGYDFKEYEKFMKDYPQMDKVIDDSCTKASDETDTLIIDARLGWFFAPQTFKVFLTCELPEAARRIMKAKRPEERYASLEVCKVATKKRFDDENARFQEKYGVSNATRNQFDLVVDTTYLSKEEVVETILAGYKKWLEE